MRSFYSVWFIIGFCLFGVAWSGCAGDAFTSVELRIGEGGEGAEAGESASGSSATGGTSGGMSATGGSENSLGGRSSGGTSSGGRSSGGSSGASSVHVGGVAGSVDTDAGQGGQSDGGEGGQGGSVGVPSCLSDGLTIQITPIGDVTVNSLCVTMGAPDTVRESGSCGNINDMDATASTFLGCVTPQPPTQGTRYCFDGLIGQGGRACDRTGQTYCGSLSQYQVSSHGKLLELSPVLYPEGCAATSTCFQALCFTIP